MGVNKFPAFFLAFHRGGVLLINSWAESRQAVTRGSLLTGNSRRLTRNAQTYFRLGASHRRLLPEAFQAGPTGPTV